MIRVYITTLGDLQIDEEDVLTSISVCEFNDNDIVRRMYYEVSKESFEGANELKNLGKSFYFPDSFNYTLNGDTNRKKLVLCQEKLTHYFGSVPDSIYFKGTRW